MAKSKEVLKHKKLVSYAVIVEECDEALNLSTLSKEQRIEVFTKQIKTLKKWVKVLNEK